jgi:hypothetical protein
LSACLHHAHRNRKVQGGSFEQFENEPHDLYKEFIMSNDFKCANGPAKSERIPRVWAFLKDSVK